MQVSQKSNFPKRMRYYQGMIDLNLIERGADYNDLRKSYIIFICPFDVFEKGLHKYTFENQCIEMPELKLDDETRKIFLCAGGTADDVSDDMKDFLDWLIGKQGKSELVKALDNAVQKARDHEEWRLEYMTVFCNHFLHIVAKGFCRLLHLHFVGKCKGTCQAVRPDRNALQT